MAAYLGQNKISAEDSVKYQVLCDETAMVGVIKQKSKNCRVSVKNISDVVYNHFTVSLNKLLGLKGINLTLKLHE